MIPPLLVQLPVHFLLLLSTLKVVVAHPDYAKPGCNYTCGDVKIPFPFGIGAGCFPDPWYEIECKASPNSNGSTSTKPFLSKLEFEVVNITVTGSLTLGIPPMNSCRADTLQQLNLSGSPYQIYRDYNVLVMEGCPGSAVMHNQSKKIMAGCATVCDDNKTEIQQPNDCYGVHCCQAPLPTDRFSNFEYPPLQFYRIDFVNRSSGDEHQDCLVATLIRSGHVNEYLSSSDRAYYNAPVVLRWSWKSNKLRDEYKSPHAICYDYEDSTSSCYCKDGYYGNPYIFNGCQVPRECMDCRGYCYGKWDMEGGLISSVYCEKKPILKLAAILGENY